MTSRAEVVAVARSLIDVPFLHQGRTRAGIDCGGVIVYVCKTLGLTQFDVTGYRRLPAGIGREKLQDICRREMIEIPDAEAQPGDALLFYDGDRPRHLAILGDYYAGGLSLIHAYQPTGKVAETRYVETMWRLFGSYRLPGVS